MSKPFFITGLPRSRTAWMAAWLSMGDSLCYHEPSMAMNKIEDLRDILSSDYYRYMGAADSGLGTHLKWVLEELKAPTLIIERNLDEVIQSLGKLGLENAYYCCELWRRISAFKDHPLVMTVQFPSLNQRRIMERVLWHLMPGTAFDESRYLMFNDLNIQCSVQRRIAQMAQRYHELRALYGEVSRETA